MRQGGKAMPVRARQTAGGAAHIRMGHRTGTAMRTKPGGIRMTREVVDMAADRIRIAGELMNRADMDLRDSRTEKRKIR